MPFTVRHEHYYYLDREVGRQLVQINSKLDAVLKQERYIMAELDNLKAAVAQTLQDISDETAEMAAVVDKLKALAAQPSIAPADVQALADQLNATHTGVQDAITAAKNAVA